MSQSPTFSLQGKVIIQFGGTGLLGPALIKALGEAGATVVVASRSRASLDSLVAQESAAGGLFTQRKLIPTRKRLSMLYVTAS